MNPPGGCRIDSRAMNNEDVIIFLTGATSKKEIDSPGRRQNDVLPDVLIGLKGPKSGPLPGL